MAAPRTEIVLKNDLAELERLGRFVRDFGARHGLAERVVFDVELALDEIVTNVISYAYDDRAAHEIRVGLELVPGELSVEVVDSGRPFDPLAAAEPDTTLPLEQRPIGGLGVFLARKVMNRLAYRREGGKNVLGMGKTIG